MLARWLTPTEGTGLGDTLWLTTLTLFVAVVVSWHRTRIGDTFRFDRLDVAVCLLCAAHVLSALWIVATDGQKRAATNMLWEWTAIAVQFLLVRASFTDPARTVFLRVFVALWVAQAGFGIWQHFVWYPQAIEEYQQHRDALDALESGTSGLTGRERDHRLHELQSWFIEQGIPMSGPGRDQIEGRLKDSADPVGFFALTNTFSGFLSVLIVLLWGVALSHWRSKRTLIAIVTLAGIAAWCLLLTKSRTAMCGAVAGLVVTTLLRQVQSHSGVQIRKLLLAIIVIPVIAGVLFGAILLFGGMDSDMLSDAPLSLKYRLYYWSATARVINDHPLLGTGPGNFRNAYLRHKVPESSEEIADPHNFVLDVTANSGLAGLAALGGMLTLAVISAGRTIATTDSELEQPSSADASRALGPLTIVAAGAVVFSWAWLIETRLELRVVCVCAAASLIAVLLESRAARIVIDRLPLVGIAGAAAGLLVHLLGAGGIAMPAVTGLLFALVAMLIPRPEALEQSIAPRSLGFGTACLLALVAAFVGCAWTALLPTLNRTASLQRGDYELTSRGNYEGAAREYHAAAEHDTLSPEPLLRLAALRRQQSAATQGKEFLQDSIEAVEVALERSPHSASIRREAAQCHLQLASGNASSNASAAHDSMPIALGLYRQALERYPTNCQWTAEYAVALSRSSDRREAMKVARRALALDDMNEELAHYDRVLSDGLRASIEAIAR